MATPADALWRFSLRSFRAPGVAEACLALQDECGADVNLLILCGWLGRDGKRLSARELRAAVSVASPWQQKVVAPLRCARRSVRKDDRRLKGVRRRIAAAELEAERIEQGLLARYAKGLSSGKRYPAQTAVCANLEAYLTGLNKRGAHRAALKLAILLARTSIPAAPRCPGQRASLRCR